MTIKSIVTKSFVCSVALATPLYAGSASAEPIIDACTALAPFGAVAVMDCKFLKCATHDGCQIHTHAGGSGGVNSRNTRLR